MAPSTSDEIQTKPAPITGALPAIPRARVLWRALRAWVWVAIVLLAGWSLPTLLVEYWFLESQNRSDVFWTNFTAQATLFVVGGTMISLAWILPLRWRTSGGEFRAATHIGVWLGLFAGWLLSGRFLTYLILTGRGSFNELDPVFGQDVGFYVFELPAIRVTLTFLTWVGITICAAALIARAREHSRGLESGITLAGLVGTPWLRAGILVAGLAVAAQTFTARYALLTMDNEASGVRTGAEYIDVNGLISTLNFITLSVLVEIGLVGAIFVAVTRLTKGAGAGVRGRPVRGPVRVAIGLLALELAFFVALVARDHLVVSPNEPTIQLTYIQRHMDATLEGYRLERVKTVPWTVPQARLTPDAILGSSTVRNAPILPGWVSHLEQPPDVQHLQRLRASQSTMVYGPMLQIYEQTQQLRPYYRFLSVDAVRYRVNGEQRMYVSGVRELPSQAMLGQQEWLRYWGSAALMYTHGFGLVMSPADTIDSAGSPLLEVRDIPPTSTDSLFVVEPRIYVGEGAKDDYILTGVRGLREFDYATRQSRSEYAFPATVPDGIPVNSVFKRIVFALHTGDATAFLFSRFISHDSTRVHVHRTPMRRARRIAPFLFLDSNPYAVAADGQILWMLNGLTTTDQYPYSFREVLGDKADERAVEPFPERIVNYAEDAVKVTIDAHSGVVRLYRITDDPIVMAWSRVYPGLFEQQVPEAVRAQFTYPLQWFHVQFDDIYKRYHQRNPIEFYNVEDLWDDADEVVGSIGRGLTQFGTTDQMTFSYEGYNVLLDPHDLPAGAHDGFARETQFALIMPFTPDGGRNLRSLVLAFQDPGHYGELLNLRVPQGTFIPGPEQADGYIDNDSQVNQQITLWVRHGSEVVRGHTLLLPVGGDVLYIEPLWITSLQNELPQIKLFSVVYRGRTTMATQLDEAIRLQGISEREEQKANEMPWFEPQRPPSETRGRRMQ